MVLDKVAQSLSKMIIAQLYVYRYSVAIAFTMCCMILYSNIPFSLLCSTCLMYMISNDLRHEMMILYRQYLHSKLVQTSIQPHNNLTTLVVNEKVVTNVKISIASPLPLDNIENNNSLPKVNTACTENTKILKSRIPFYHNKTYIQTCNNSFECDRVVAELTTANNSGSMTMIKLKDPMTFADVYDKAIQLSAPLKYINNVTLSPNTKKMQTLVKAGKNNNKHNNVKELQKDQAKNTDGMLNLDLSSLDHTFGVRFMTRGMSDKKIIKRNNQNDKNKRTKSPILPVAVDVVEHSSYSDLSIKSNENDSTTFNVIILRDKITFEPSFLLFDKTTNDLYLCNHEEKENENIVDVFDRNDTPKYSNSNTPTGFLQCTNMSSFSNDECIYNALIHHYIVSEDQHHLIKFAKSLTAVHLDKHSCLVFYREPHPEEISRENIMKNKNILKSNYVFENSLKANLSKSKNEKIINSQCLAKRVSTLKHICKASLYTSSMCVMSLIFISNF